MKTFLKLCSVLFIFVFSAIAFAQGAIVPASIGTGGAIWVWVTAHGGPVGSLLLLIGSFNVLMAMLRDQLAKWDNVDLTLPIPPQWVALTWSNKLAYYSGKIIDFVTANIQHK